MNTFRILKNSNASIFPEGGAGFSAFEGVM
jgi:hypothetical protein